MATMGRFDGFLLLWERMLVAVGVTAKPWMLPAFVLLLGAASWPLVRRTQRISRARKLIAEAGRVSGPERTAVQDRVLALVGVHPMGLVGVVEEAHRRQQLPLARRGLDALRDTGKERIHLMRLEALVEGPPPTSIEGELAALERLLDEDMLEQAQRRLARARRRWPDDPRLAAVELRSSR